ncbi:recombinase family protein [Vagococcus sp. BWB3-3]|uniref:Recombinase family protein n=1 Tax=Vagococcus allomyrinae TaxID=2794353 RepID=A0A940ST96_9ENTE|nr:recombinase family protein [Vagococcus allomyrinae]MBP1039434.1 recombinase family protein [Vagococcus allomyrinae]
MSKFGYMIVQEESGETKSFNQMLAHGCDEIVIETGDNEKLNKLLDKLVMGDELVVESLESLGLFSEELMTLMKRLDKLNVSLFSLADQKNMTEPWLISFQEVLYRMVEMDHQLREKRGPLTQSTEKEVGRPGISEEKVQIIAHLYDRQVSYRKISGAANVSIGTVHKYVQKIVEKRKKDEIANQYTG